MDVLALIVTIAIVWLVLATAAALVIGRVIRRRDSETEHDDNMNRGAESVERMAEPRTIARSQKLPHAA